MSVLLPFCAALFLSNDTATTAIYTLSLHDALPILALWPATPAPPFPAAVLPATAPLIWAAVRLKLTADRKSTRLNSSHQIISYAVFCLKKKKEPLLQL